MSDLEPVSASNLSDIPSISHGFFTRKGGVSQNPKTGLLEDLDIGLFIENNAKAAVQNRERIKDFLNANHLLSLNQIHSNKVMRVKTPSGWDFHQQADALVCNQPDIAIGAITADCGPLLFVDPEAKVIGSAHAGWKGAVGGILQNTVEAMEQLGAKTSNIHAALGPCIQQASYEVGPEFFKQFCCAEPENERFFIPSLKAEHFMFDLAGFIVEKLKAIGLKTINSTGEDTCSDSDRFFSYRRGTLSKTPETARHISAICLSR